MPEPPVSYAHHNLYSKQKKHNETIKYSLGNFIEIINEKKMKKLRYTAKIFDQHNFTIFYQSIFQFILK